MNKSLFKNIGATFVAKIRGWYLGLGHGDQVAILILIVFLGVTLITWSVVLPSFKYRQTSLAEYQQQQELFDSLLGNPEYIKSARSATVEEAQGSILSAIDGSAQEHSISFQRYEPTENNGVRLLIEDVQFSDLITWLGGLSTSHNIHIEQISIEKQDGSGIVNARIDLAP